MKMLIAFQKNSQNREATQAGGGGGEGGFGLGGERQRHWKGKQDFTIQ